MKKPLLYSLLATSFFLAKAQAQSYYWVYGQKVPVTIDSSRFTIESQETLSREAVRRSLGDASLKSEIRSGNQSNRFLVNVKDFVKASGRRSLRVRALPSSNVHYALKLRNGDVVTPTGDIVFQPKQRVRYEQVAKRLKGSITLLKSTPYNTFLVHPTNPDQLLALANKIYESGLVEWAQPDFYSSFRPFQNDPLYPNQYYLNNTGQTGGASDVDINAPEAWCLTKGSSSIRVAVIDEGVEAH